MKKVAIYLSIVFSLLFVSFTLLTKSVSAETSKKVDVINSINLSNDSGGELTGSLGLYDRFRVNATFALEGKNVKEGDTSELVLENPLIIDSTNFEIKDKATGKVIANAVVDKETGKIVLTFTKFVETKNDVSGSFFFYSMIDRQKHPKEGDVPVTVKVNNKTKFTGKVKAGEVGQGGKYIVAKSGWDVNKEHKQIGFRISVNRTGEAIPNAVITDTLKSTGVSYTEGSFKIYKGTFKYDNGWKLENKTDVTNDYAINVSGNSFSVNLGSLSKDDHFVIEYTADLSYMPVDGEKIENDVTISGNGSEINHASSAVKIQIAGGTGVGYDFGIKIHKVDENNKSLKGAKFQVIRVANNQLIGEFETNKDGEIVVKNLLRDQYIIKEISAPEGYDLAADTVVEAGEFKTPEAPVEKTIVDQKTTTTTTTTTTAEPTTTTTTTAEPTTTTTTTAEPTTTTTTTAEPTTTTTTTAEPTTTTTTTAEPTTTTTTTAEPTTTTTTTAEPTTTTTTAEPTTTTTTEEPTTTTTTTTAEPTTTSTTTTEEPTTTSTTTTEEPTTTSTTTTEEPTTTSTTTTEEPTTTTTTTTEEPTTTTTEEPTTTTTTTAEPTTTTTTTAEPTPTTTTTPTPEKPVTPGSEESTTTTTTGKPGPKGGNNGGGRKALLPNTGEVAATGFVFSGAFVLAGAVVLKRKLSIK